MRAFKRLFDMEAGLYQGRAVSRPYLFLCDLGGAVTISV